MLNYSINNAAGAIPGPAHAAAVTRLHSPAPASSSGCGARTWRRALCGSGDVSWPLAPKATTPLGAGSLAPGRDPRLPVAAASSRGPGGARGGWGGPKPFPAGVAPSPQPVLRSLAPGRLLQLFSVPQRLKHRSGDSFALKAGICSFYYIRTKGTACPPISTVPLGHRVNLKLLIWF